MNSSRPTPRGPALAGASSDPPGVAARRQALRLVDRVLRHGQRFEATGEPGRDAALAEALARETLRWLRDLDALIDSATQRPLPPDAKARAVLRVALAGALVHHTPAHAAIATALPLVEGGPRRLVHGVLGTLLRRRAALPPVPSLPADIEARWRAAWGDAAVAAARAALARPAPLDVTYRTPAEATLAAGQGGESLLPGHLRLADMHFAPTLAGFADGEWWVQDLAASLPARLLGARPGEAVVDLCAAPGGKTLQLAAAGARVTALDVSDARLDRLRDNLARTGLAAEIVAADALAWPPPEPPARILLDAPCSSSGVFRRHPDILHLPRDLVPLVALQAALLDRALDLLPPGGTLVYATCSLEPAEGEDQLAALLARRPDARLDPIAAGELPAGLAPHPRGWVRTLPGDLAEVGGVDGFFIARLQRDGARYGAEE